MILRCCSGNLKKNRSGGGVGVIGWGGRDIIQRPARTNAGNMKGALLRGIIVDLAAGKEGI